MIISLATGFIALQYNPWTDICKRARCYRKLANRESVDPGVQVFPVPPLRVAYEALSVPSLCFSCVGNEWPRNPHAALRSTRVLRSRAEGFYDRHFVTVS